MESIGSAISLIRSVDCSIIIGTEPSSCPCLVVRWFCRIFCNAYIISMLVVSNLHQFLGGVSLVSSLLRLLLLDFFLYLFVVWDWCKMYNVCCCVRVADQMLTCGLIFLFIYQFCIVSMLVLRPGWEGGCIESITYGLYTSNTFSLIRAIAIDSHSLINDFGQFSVEWPVYRDP